MIKKCFIVLLLSIEIVAGFSQNNDSDGRRFIQNYEDNEFANNQIWDIVQDKRGVMYFGTTSGIVEFDGSKWQLIETSNNSGIRSLDIDSLGVIYVGATGELGYLACNNKGKIRYYSLKHYLDSTYRNFTDVWQVKATKYGVYFCTSKYIFQYFNDTIIPLDINSNSVYSLNTKENLYAITRNNYINLVQDDTIKELPFTNHLNNSRNLVTLLPFSEEKLLFATIDGFFEYNFDLLEHFSEKYSDEIDSSLFVTKLKTNFLEYIREMGIYTSIRISEDLYAIGTRSGGVVFFNSNGDYTFYIDKNGGLPDNTILSLYMDKFGDLWVGTNSGIARVEINSPITYFDDKNGLKGSVLNFREFNGEYYAGTQQGIFRLNKEKEGFLLKNKFSFLSKVKSTCWDFYIYNNDLLLASGDDDVERIEDGNVIDAINTEKVFCFGDNKKFPNTIFIGIYNGFGYFDIDRTKNKYTYQNYHTIDEVDATIRLIATDTLNNLWLTSEYNGIYCVKFSDDSIEKYTVEKYDTTDGLPQMDFNYVFNINGIIRVGTAKGLYKVIENKQKNEKPYSIVKDSTFGSVFNLPENSIGSFMYDKNKTLWISADYGFGPLIKNGNKYQWDTIPFKRIDTYDFNFDNKGNIWGFGANRLLKYDRKKKFDYYNSFNTIIRKVQLGNDSVLVSDSYFNEKTIGQLNANIIALEQPKRLMPVLKYKNNSMTFNFTAAYYIEKEKIQFRYKLEGFDKDWSDWSDELKKEYTNLPEGEYNFTVQAKNIFSIVGKTATYKFSILPPWYRTFYAYIGYLVIITFIFYIVITLNIKRLKAANIKLERIVRERTAEIEHQKEDILERNFEISRQKEELAEQAKQLELTNVELEKLSIVASKTDNAVIIMDSKGKFEWINEGFTRMYGLTFEQLISERGDNIFDTSTNEYVHELIKDCVNQKKTVIYESMIIPNEGNNIWAQTTLTPIVNETGEVVKLIAIDTDIGQVKTAEIEISNQKEELLAQSEMLAEINNELERNNLLITDSISYAKRIQEAILPSEKMIRKYFPESFVFFKPKDIVSGDFFWFLKPETDEWGKSNNKIFIAAVDCTGHGVPGAFMSMIGNTLLNDIVGNDKIFKPSEILNKLNTGIIELLKQKKETEDSQDDGMDITICKIDPDIGELEIALANHTAYIRQGDELKSIEGDMFSIGGFFAKRFKPKFKNHVYEIDENTSLYLFSDGFKDQFGGENGQKFIETRFKKMIEDNMNRKFEEQKLRYSDIFNDWKSNFKQIDDVMLIGLKFSGLEDLY